MVESVENVEATVTPRRFAGVDELRAAVGSHI
jgi:hypothetical protein